MGPSISGEGSALSPMNEHGKDYFETLPEDLIIKIVAQSSLSTRQRAQAMCVSKAWRKLGLENWIGVDLDTVADYQMPLVLKFVDRLGLHSAERLQHISFPYTAASQVRVPGYLDYWHFKALTSLDFGITPPEMRESGPFCWALCPKEIQSLSSLKNLKRLRATFLCDQHEPVIDLEALSGLLKLSEADLRMACEGPNRFFHWPTVQLSKKLEGLVHLQSLELHQCDLIVNDVFKRLAHQLTSMDIHILNPENETIETPQLTTAKLSGEGIYEMTLNYPLRNAKKLHNLKLYGILVKKLDYHLLPALTHLTWDDGVSPKGQIMETIPPLANASRLKSLELGSYTPLEPGTISEIQRYCPSLEALQINDLEGGDFRTGLFESGCMQHLKKLIVEFDTSIAQFVDVSLCLNENSLPVLQHLEVSSGFFLEHLKHSKLETLKIKSRQLNEQHAAVHLGDLPALKRLHLSLRIEKIKDVVALASCLPKMPNVEDVYFENCSIKLDSEISIFDSVFEASRDWCKIKKLELVESKANVVVPRQSIMHLKHIGIVCKNLTIPQTCLPFPVKSLCFQTDEELAAPDGMVVRQLYVDAGYDSFRREQTQKQVWQAYRHDFELPDKDWLPKSKELLSVMRQRLSHV